MSGIYSKISKINKQKLDKIESALFGIKSEIKKIETGIKETYELIDSLDIPQSGDMKELKSFSQRRRLLDIQKQRYMDSLHVKNLELARKYEEYKKAKIEYEKIKYLEEQEVAQKLKKLKKDEQKELDEISSLLFKRSSG